MILLVAALFISVLAAAAERSAKREGVEEGVRMFRKDAVERGYAVWDVTDPGTGESTFRWLHSVTTSVEEAQ